jgi:hypothetical protein
VDGALSKSMHEMHATTISMHTFNLSDKILEVSKSNQNYVDIKENLQKRYVGTKI